MFVVLMGILLCIGMDTIGEQRMDLITLQWTTRMVITIASRICTLTCVYILPIMIMFVEGTCATMATMSTMSTMSTLAAMTTMTMTTTCNRSTVAAMATMPTSTATMPTMATGATMTIITTMDTDSFKTVLILLYNMF